MGSSKNVTIAWVREFARGCWQGWLVAQDCVWWDANEKVLTFGSSHWQQQWPYYPSALDAFLQDSLIRNQVVQTSSVVNFKTKFLSSSHIFPGNRITWKNTSSRVILCGKSWVPAKFLYARMSCSWDYLMQTTRWDPLIVHHSLWRNKRASKSWKSSTEVIQTRVKSIMTSECSIFIFPREDVYKNMIPSRGLFLEDCSRSWWWEGHVELAGQLLM